MSRQRMHFSNGENKKKNVCPKCECPQMSRDAKTCRNCGQTLYTGRAIEAQTYEEYEEEG